MSDDDRIEFELNINKMIDEVADDYFNYFQAKARNIAQECLEEGILSEEEVEELDLDNIPSVQERSDIKTAVKTLIPYKSPTTSFITAQILMVLLKNAMMSASIKMMMENPSAVQELLDQLREGDSTQKVFSKIQERQDSLSQRYRDVDMGDKRFKVADLGDVSQGIVLN